MARRCRHCNANLTHLDEDDVHFCPKQGQDFLVSAVIGAVTDSALLGAGVGMLLGGSTGASVAGGLLGDILDGDLFD